MQPLRPNQEAPYAPIFRRLAIWLLCWTIISGCATFAPPPIDLETLRREAVTQTESDVRVSATVLGAEETRAVFGFALYRKGIQPVWLEIDNRSPYRLWFPPVSVDPDYFAPLEVAYMHHSGHSRASRASIDRFFHQQALRGPISPGRRRSGFVFTQLKLGTKAFNVELIGDDHRIRAFTFLIPVAGLDVDHRQVDWLQLYTEDKIVEIESLPDLRDSLEAIPCCTTNADGDRLADPINVVIIGRGKDILYTLLRSGWDETAAASSYDPMTRLPWEFRYQPVKTLYFFDRAQDAAFRKSRSTLNERNQLRLWLSPYVVEGKPVWVGQISRILRHAIWDRFRIEPDVDEARAYLLQNLWTAQALSRYAYVRKNDVVSIDKPRKSLHDDSYFTDGLCLVVWISDRPVSFSKVGFVPWEVPVLDRRRLLRGR